jgi:hypothetical protein
VSPEASLETLRWLMRAIGLLQLLSGLRLLNAWRLHSFRPDRPAEGGLEAIRGWTVLAVGALTLHAGLALVLLSPLTPYLFLACAAVQGAYLAWARKAMPPKGEAQARARGKSMNAFFLFLAVTLLVLGCRAVGLFSAGSAPAPSITVGPSEITR